MQALQPSSRHTPQNVQASASRDAPQDVLQPSSSQHMQAAASSQHKQASASSQHMQAAASSQHTQPAASPCDSPAPARPSRASSVSPRVEGGDGGDRGGTDGRRARVPCGVAWEHEDCSLLSVEEREIVATWAEGSSGVGLASPSLPLVCTPRTSTPRAFFVSPETRVCRCPALAYTIAY